MKGAIAANTAPIPIAVIADNEEHLIPLPNTIHDATLSHSVISKHIALATHGPILPVLPVSLPTALGPVFTSSATITLRWRYDAGLQSFQECFYIVDELPASDPHLFDTTDTTYHAILRRDIPRLDGEEAGMAFPIQFGKPTKKGREEKGKKERDREINEEKWRKEMEMQKNGVRRELGGGGKLRAGEVVAGR